MRMALDASARSVSADGHLHIERSHISKATVNPYYGREVPGGVEIGLDPNRLYYFLRDPKELADGAASFAGKPILSQHIPISADDHPHDLVVGSIGSNVAFNAPYLDADLAFWDADAIAGIQSNKKRELSAAYRWMPLMTPGTYEGQRYDGVMTNLIGNHLALVEAGRAGSDVLAADSKPKGPNMTRKGNALKLALSAFSTKLAQDAALPGLVANAGTKQFDRNAVTTKLMAMDEDIDKEKLIDVVEAILDDDPAEDEAETEEEKEARLKREAADKDKDKKAMDAALKSATDKAVADLKAADAARRAVKHVVGDVIAQDSAADIYSFALDEMKVKHEGVTDGTALKAIFDAANVVRPSVEPVIAQDSASAVQMFPGLARF